MGTIRINGNTFSGSCISVNNGKITIDEKFKLKTYLAMFILS